MSTFGKRIRELREERGLSQKDMIEYLGHRGINISKGGFSKWESGTHEAGYSTLKVLCIYFNVTCDYLLGITDKKSD